MEARDASALADQKMRFTVLASSVERHWTGITATLYKTSGGFSQSSPGAYHCLTMHLSAPIHADCSFEGKGRPRLQVAGDIDLLPAGSSAAWRDDGETVMIGVKLDPSLVDGGSIAPQMQLRDPQIEHLLWALKSELESGETFGRVYAESIATALASHLRGRYAERSAACADGFPGRRLQRVLDYIDENLSAELSLFELASIANLSPSQFKSVFKRLLGMPVHQYIIRQRVKCAVQLIAQDRLPLSDIAIQAGFSNQSHMSRLTRRLIGATPGQIRGI